MHRTLLRPSFVSYEFLSISLALLLATGGCVPTARIAQPATDATKDVESHAPPELKEIQATPDQADQETPAAAPEITAELANKQTDEETKGTRPSKPDMPASASEKSTSETSNKPAEVLVVCPPKFRDALSPWSIRRQAEGLVVTIINSEPTADELAESIRNACSSECRYVWLIGDAEPTPNREPLDPNQFVPTRYLPADVSQTYQSTRTLAGDYGYGDLNQDGTIDASVGRLPVRTPEQISQYVTRLIAYEDDTQHVHWRSQVDLIAGLGGFGAMIDGAIEFAAGGIVTGSLPGYVNTRITHAGPTSMFHPGSENFSDQVLKNYADGGRFWVYAGHGWVNQLDRVPATGIGRPILTTNDVGQLKRQPEQATIALLLACYTGAYDAAEDCLAEAMLRTDQGPIAVIAGSRVTMPYANSAVAIALIHAIYKQRAQRLGDAWLQTLHELSEKSQANPELQLRRSVIDGLATLLGSPRLDDERLEHRQLYNCLGDPTLRLNPPLEMDVKSPSHLILDQGFTVSGKAPDAGSLTIEVHRRVGSQPIKVNTESKYDEANDTLLLSKQLTINQGEWQCEFAVDEPLQSFASLIKLPVPVVIKAEWTSPKSYAFGSAEAWLRPTTPASKSKK